jgi:hypothetical protein
MSSPAQTQIQTAITSGTYTGTSRSATSSITSTAAPSTGGSGTNTGLYRSNLVQRYYLSHCITPTLGAIAGGVVGGVLGIGLLVLITWFFFRKKPVKNDPPPMQENFPAGGYAGQPGYVHSEQGYPVQQSIAGSHYTPVPLSQGGTYGQGLSVYDQPYGAPTTPGTSYKPYDPR